MPHKAIKDNVREQQVIHLRIIVALVFVMLLLLVLFARYFFLQIISFEKFETASEYNRVHLQRLPPQRGLIFDMN